MEQDSEHPTHRTLDFREIANGVPSSVADMLRVNKRVDRIHFYPDTSDRNCWNAFIVPIIDCKCLVAIEKIQDPSTRAAVVALALARVERKPWLVWMVLSQNHDVVYSYLGEARDDSSVSVPSR